MTAPETPSRDWASGAGRLPLVTVGIPTLGRVRLLERAIRSVLDQTLTDWTGIVADNSNSPEAGALVASFRDPRLRYVGHPRNLTGGGNFNYLFSAAKTEYLCLLHDDDCYEPRYLERMVAAMQAHPSAQWGFCNCRQVIEATGESRPWTTTSKDQVFPAGGALMRWLASGHYICCPTVIYHQDIFSTRRFDTAYSYAGDCKLFAELARDCDAVFVGEPLYRYSNWTGNETTRGRGCALAATEQARLQHELLAWPELTEARRFLAQRLRRETRRLCWIVLASPPSPEDAEHLPVIERSKTLLARATGFAIRHSWARRLLRGLAQARERRRARRNARRQLPRDSVAGEIA